MTENRRPAAPQQPAQPQQREPVKKEDIKVGIVVYETKDGQISMELLGDGDKKSCIDILGCIEVARRFGDNIAASAIGTLTNQGLSLVNNKLDLLRRAMLTGDVSCLKETEPPPVPPAPNVDAPPDTQPDPTMASQPGVTLEPLEDDAEFPVNELEGQAPIVERPIPPANPPNQPKFDPMSLVKKPKNS